ncbi:MAG: hypothetical protein NW703_02690 [Nitrospiraceae bacterium]
MITDSIRDDLQKRSEALLFDLAAPNGWLEDVVGAYNRAVIKEPKKSVPCNPLLLRILHDHLHDDPVAVPAIQGLVTHYKALAEFSDREWRNRKARILGNDVAGFHSTLVEISLHKFLSGIPGLSVRFIDPEPGVRRRTDYQIRIGNISLDAELKSIFSDQVRLADGTLPMGYNAEPTTFKSIASERGLRAIGAPFAGSTIDSTTAKVIWRKFSQPIRERQLDTSRPSAIFVDISTCDELCTFLAPPCLIQSSELRNHARSLLRQLAAVRRAEVPASLQLMVCGFTPWEYEIWLIEPVSVEGRFRDDTLKQ